MTAGSQTQQSLPLPDIGAGVPCHPAEADPRGDEQDLWVVPGLMPLDEIGRIDLESPEWLSGADVVVVDIETTGWLADAARITEIGAVRLSRNELAGDWPATGRTGAEFSGLVNPGAPIPAVITELTGITDQMVAGAPGIEQVLPEFLDFAAGAVLVAHNASFDLGFLTAASATCGIPWPLFPVIDTALLSRLVLGPGDVADHKLTTLAGYFSTAAGPCHRALDDARATVEVLAGLLRLLPAGDDWADTIAPHPRSPQPGDPPL